jgi:hypothetical protein
MELAMVLVEAVVVTTFLTLMALFRSALFEQEPSQRDTLHGVARIGYFSVRVQARPVGIIFAVNCTVFISVS